MIDLKSAYSIAKKKELINGKLLCIREFGDYYLAIYKDGDKKDKVSSTGLLITKSTGNYKYIDILSLAFDKDYQNSTKLDISEFEKDGN